MKRLLRTMSALATALLGPMMAIAATPTSRLMNWDDLARMPQGAPTRRIAYGPDPLQHADLWLPEGKGPHPVVLMIHGGCWQSDVAQADIMNPFADSLRARGIAVWNIDYRGIDRPGGGYPGTFRDVAAAADLLGREGGPLGLATGRVVAIGHSAGGHLALWLAGRGRIARGSPLYTPAPLRLAAAISVGGLPDLEAAQRPPGDTCGADTVHRLLGDPGRARPDIYADTSPAALMPFATPQISVNATRDPIAPPAFAEAYAVRARRLGVTVRRLTITNEGHAELIAPHTAAWSVEVAEIERLLARHPRREK